MNKKDLKIRGIAALIKEKLSDMITASDDITPKRAHSRLIKQRKKSNEYSAELIPTLIQVIVL